MDQYAFAAHWWGEQLKNPHFDNGAKDLTAASLNTMIFAKSGSPTPTQLEQFEKELCSILQKRRVSSLGVDYDPDSILCEAASGMEDSRLTLFPWKTSMYLGNDEISVRRGYGARTEVIWKNGKEVISININEKPWQSTRCSLPFIIKLVCLSRNEPLCMGCNIPREECGSGI